MCGNNYTFGVSMKVSSYESEHGGVAIIGRRRRRKERVSRVRVRIRLLRCMITMGSVTIHHIYKEIYS